MTLERQYTINRVLTLRQPDLTVITESVVKNRNRAAMVRTCDAVGIHKMHCVESPEAYRRYRGTSARPINMWTWHFINVCLSPSARLNREVFSSSQHIFPRVLSTTETLTLPSQPYS